MSREMFSGNLRNRLHSDEWLIWQDQYEAKENLKYESLFALSNGYLGIRGSHEEGTKITLPYLYINGVFDKSETFMRELSTLPNWLGIRLYVEKELIGIEDCEILEFSRVLDMKGAFLGKRDSSEGLKRKRDFDRRNPVCEQKQCTQDGNPALCDTAQLQWNY